MPPEVVARAQHNLGTLALLIAERLPDGDGWQQMITKAVEVIDEALAYYIDADDLIALADTRMSQALVSLHVAERFPDDENAEIWLRDAMPGFASALKAYEGDQDRQRFGAALLNMASTASLLAGFEEDEEAHKLHSIASRSIDRATNEFTTQEHPVMLRRSVLAQANILTRLGRFEGGGNGRDIIARAVTLLDHLAESLKPAHDPALWAEVMETRPRMRVDLSEIDKGAAAAHLAAAREELVSIRIAVADDPAEVDRIDGLLDTVTELQVPKTD